MCECVLGLFLYVIRVCCVYVLSVCCVMCVLSGVLCVCVLVKYWEWSTQCLPPDQYKAISWKLTTVWRVDEKMWTSPSLRESFKARTVLPVMIPSIPLISWTWVSPTWISILWEQAIPEDPHARFFMLTYKHVHLDNSNHLLTRDYNITNICICHKAFI